MNRTRPIIGWVRSIHRWISLAFVASAALTLTALPPGTPAGDVVSTIAIALLLLLLVSGLWVAVHHYVVRARRPRRVRGTAPA